MDENDELRTPEAIAGYLALKHANGMSFKDLLDLHTEILIAVGKKYVSTWGCDPPMPHDEDLKDGAYYVLGYLEDDDEWYNFSTLDGPDVDA